MAKELKESEFETAIKNEKVILDFYADWCGPCQMFKPTFDAVSEEMKDISFYKINVETAPSIPGKFGISSIPTIVFLKNGEEVGRVNGAMPRPMFESKIKEIFK